MLFYTQEISDKFSITFELQSLTPGLGVITLCHVRRNYIRVLKTADLDVGGIRSEISLAKSLFLFAKHKDCVLTTVYSYL